MRVGPQGKLSAEELMLLNCGVGETLESPLDSEEIKPIKHKGNQPLIFINRSDAEAEVPIFWPPDLMLGKIEDKRRRGCQRMRGC